MIKTLEYWNLAWLGLKQLIQEDQALISLNHQP